MVIADIDSRQSSDWKWFDTGRLVRIPKETIIASFDPDAFKEQLKAEMAEQTQTIMWEMLAEMIEAARQKQHVSQPLPFDLDAENSKRQQIDDDQETLLAELVARQNMDT